MDKVDKPRVRAELVAEHKALDPALPSQILYSGGARYRDRYIVLVPVKLRVGAGSCMQAFPIALAEIRQPATSPVSDPISDKLNFSFAPQLRTLSGPPREPDSCRSLSFDPATAKHPNLRQSIISKTRLEVAVRPSCSGCWSCPSILTTLQAEEISSN